MRAPPPVEYPSVLGHAWRGALSTFVGAAVALPLAGGLPWLAAWMNDFHVEWLRTALAMPALPGDAAWVAGLAALVAAWRSSSRKTAMSRKCTLRWDGQDWLLPGGDHGPDQRGAAALMLDLGPWLLVRFTPHGAGWRSSAWLPFTLDGDDARWAALRGALWTWRASTTRSA